MAISFLKNKLMWCKEKVEQGRQKNIVRPEKISYMGMHLVATGPREYLLDPVHQMRVVHYKPLQLFDDLDESMLQYAQGVRSMLHHLGFQ